MKYAMDAATKAAKTMVKANTNANLPATASDICDIRDGLHQRGTWILFRCLQLLSKSCIHEGGPMNEDRVKGVVDEVVGTVKRKAGQLTGDTQLQVEGMAQQMKGKVETAWGKTKDVVQGAVEDISLPPENSVTRIEPKNGN
jgi:uncharacterized protein YjbJ (UPF0337 family)